MENFDEPYKKIREKKLYVLHLDTARIVLISAAVIGIITASFLLGMNFINHHDGNGTSFALNDPVENQKEIDLLKDSIPTDRDSNELTKPTEEKLEPIKENNDHIRENPGIIKKDKNSKKHIEVVTGDNINETIPSLNERKVEKKIQNVHKRSKKAAALTRKKRHNRKHRAKKRKRHNNVIEVSDKSTSSHRYQGSGYSIQIASFDKNSKAASEMHSLKKMRYDAHIESTRVQGKRYYRVKIGPITSKRKALSLLNTLQETHRYRNSYMVRN